MKTTTQTTAAETALLIIAKALVSGKGRTPCELTSEVRNGIAYAYSVERVGEGPYRCSDVFVEVHPSGKAYVNNREVAIL